MTFTAVAKTLLTDPVTEAGAGLLLAFATATTPHGLGQWIIQMGALGLLLHALARSEPV